MRIYSCSSREFLFGAGRERKGRRTGGESVRRSGKYDIEKWEARKRMTKRKRNQKVDTMEVPEDEDGSWKWVFFFSLMSSNVESSRVALEVFNKPKPNRPERAKITRPKTKTNIHPKERRNRSPREREEPRERMKSSLTALHFISPSRVVSNTSN